MTTTPKRCRRLTKEEKQLVYASPESNAGAGWVPTHRDERVAEKFPEYERKVPKDVDKEFK